MLPLRVRLHADDAIRIGVTLLNAGAPLGLRPSVLRRPSGGASSRAVVCGGVVCAGRDEQRGEALGCGGEVLVDRRTADTRRLGGSIASGLIATPWCAGLSMSRGRSAIPSPAATSACARGSRPAITTSCSSARPPRDGCSRSASNSPTTRPTSWRSALSSAPKCSSSPPCGVAHVRFVSDHTDERCPHRPRRCSPTACLPGSDHP